MLWLVSQFWSDSDSSSGMMDGVRGQEWRRIELGGEVAKCVAMNLKKGMKRRPNERERAKARHGEWRR